MKMNGYKQLAHTVPLWYLGLQDGVMQDHCCEGYSIVARIYADCDAVERTTVGLVAASFSGQQTT